MRRSVPLFAYFPLRSNRGLDVRTVVRQVLRDAAHRSPSLASARGA
jgi:hypothetical protein